jgi:hypothetical protein
LFAQGSLDEWDKKAAFAGIVNRTCFCEICFAKIISRSTPLANPAKTRFTSPKVRAFKDAKQRIFAALREKDFFRRGICCSIPRSLGYAS